MSDDHVQIEVRIDSDLRYVRFVGRAIREFCMSSRIAVSEANEVELSIVEALNNAIEHAYEFRPGNEVHIGYQFDAATLTIEIRDFGNSCPTGIYDADREIDFDPDDVDTWPEGGMGIALMQTCMDDVSYAPGSASNVLTLKKRCAIASELERAASG